MSSSQPDFRFGEFLLNVNERRLLCHGKSVPLTPKVFDTLLLLVKNAGHLVEKDAFFQHLWPDTVVEESSLAQNISVLRKVLGDDRNGNNFIETVPKRGYRFVVEVRTLNGLDRHNGIKEAAATPQFLNGLTKKVKTSPSPYSAVELDGRGDVAAIRAPARASTEAGSGVWRNRLILAVRAVGVTLVAGLTTYFSLAPRALPRVTRATQITRSGRVDPWGRLVSDGARIYFLEREGDHWNLAQTSLNGGGTQLVPAPFRNTRILDISAVNSEFLVASFAVRGTLMPLWVWPVQGGPPRRLGEITAYDAAWHPDGRQIVYASDGGIFMADTDGTNPHKFAATKGEPCCFSWSPDGRRLRFTVSSEGNYGSAIWEVSSDGTDLHRLLEGWNNPPREWGGAWTPDGRYFFFESHHEGTTDIWAVREKRGLLRGRNTAPVRLTVGPGDFLTPLLSKDGPKLYVFGWNAKSELLSYDPKSRQSAPLVPSLLGWSAAYSPDGQWIAYNSDGALWRVRRDGSGRVSVTGSSFDGYDPRWSPDGKQIAFTRSAGIELHKIYVVSTEGGPAKQLFSAPGEQGEATWSPDSKFVAFSRFAASDGFTVSGIEIFDFSTNRAALAPGSEGKRMPVWSPDGRFIAAVTSEQHKVMLFDLHSHQWRELGQGALITGLTWSPGGESLYFQDLLEPNQPIYRFRLSDGRSERIADFETLLHAGIQRCGFLGLTPDGALAIAALRTQSDIYSFDLEVP